VTKDEAMDLILAYGRWCHAKGRAGVGTTTEEWKLLDDLQDDTKAALLAALLSTPPASEGEEYVVVAGTEDTRAPLVVLKPMGPPSWWVCTGDRVRVVRVTPLREGEA
jgi:hypothetical protein